MNNRHEKNQWLTINKMHPHKNYNEIHIHLESVQIFQQELILSVGEG